MKITDRIYGDIIIRETILIDLINSTPLQRLKNINQSGASQYLFPWKNVTRYEHCVGVMLLLKKFGADIQEQIAGLLHDIPHTAFSHVADYVYENEHHEFHELFHHRIITASEIPQILKKHGMISQVTDPEYYPLLEKNKPDLCADRIDYSLRDHYVWKKDTESILGKLSGLIVEQDEFMFSNIYAAESFANDYLELDQKFYTDPREGALYIILAQAIRHALEKKIISHQDMFLDDKTLLFLLKTKGDVYVQKKLAYLSPTFRVEPATKDYHHLYVKSKSRYVDPKVKINKSIQRLSQLSKKFAEKLAAHRARPKGKYVFIYPW